MEYKTCLINSGILVCKEKSKVKVYDIKRFYAKGHSNSLIRPYLMTEKSVLKSWIKISLQSSSSKHMLQDFTHARFQRNTMKCYSFISSLLCCHLPELTNHTSLTPHLQQVEVSVELRALGVFQPLQLSGDEQEDVLDTRQGNT